MINGGKNRWSRRQRLWIAFFVISCTALIRVRHLKAQTGYTLLDHDLQKLTSGGSVLEKAMGFQNQVPSQRLYPATVVTAYFPLKKGSKHSIGKYKKWVSNFFPHVRAPIVAYLPPGEITDVLKEMRGDLPFTIKVSIIYIILLLPAEVVNSCNCKTDHTSLGPPTGQEIPQRVWNFAASNGSRKSSSQCRTLRHMDEQTMDAEPSGAGEYLQQYLFFLGGRWCMEVMSICQYIYKVQYDRKQHYNHWHFWQ